MLSPKPGNSPARENAIGVTFFHWDQAVPVTGRNCFRSRPALQLGHRTADYAQLIHNYARQPYQIIAILAIRRCYQLLIDYARASHTGHVYKCIKCHMFFKSSGRLVGRWRGKLSPHCGHVEDAEKIKKRKSEICKLRDVVHIQLAVSSQLLARSLTMRLDRRRDALVETRKRSACGVLEHIEKCSERP